MTKNCTLYEYLNNAIHSPSARKLIYFDNIISADELLLSTHKIATFLSNSGVQPQDTVGIALPNMPEAIMACYGINRMGGIANIMHPKLGKQAVRELLISTKTKVIFILDSIYKLHSDTLRELNILAVICSPSYYMAKHKSCIVSLFEPKINNEIKFKDIMALSPSFVDNTFDANLPAVYIHSGGTSGLPKTAILSSYAINSVVEGIMRWVHQGDASQCQDGCVLMALPIFHCFGLTVTMHSAVSNSCALLIPQFKAKNVVKVLKNID